VSHLSKRDRFLVLEMVTEIASEAAKNANVDKMVELQGQLVESLYRKMTAMLEEDLERVAAEDYEDEYEEDDDDEDDDDDEELAEDDAEVLSEETEEVERLARDRRVR
jgi:coproporphyrinogen III oxidase-like Fe-S oxidoreductase